MAAPDPATPLLSNDEAAAAGGGPALKKAQLAQHVVTLTKTELTYRGDRSDRSLRLETVGGATTDGSALLVHDFPLGGGGCCGGGLRRKQVDVRLPCASPAQATEWRDAIRQLLLTGGLAGPLPSPRRLLVLINPFSGTRKGRQVLADTRHIL